MENKVLETENKEFGFYGTINLHYSEKETNKKWGEAFTTLLELSGKQPQEIRTYLDSRSGRKLADCIIDSRDNLKTTIIKEYLKWGEDDLFDCKLKTLITLTKYYSEQWFMMKSKIKKLQYYIKAIKKAETGII